MNIVVRDFVSGKFMVRPDTSWERENRDYYMPEQAESLFFSPILFARICKAGKCVGEKFADRYYDSIGYGMLMYIGSLMQDGCAFSSCADHTSILPFPMFNRITLDNEQNIFEITKNGSTIFKTSEGKKGMIEKAVSAASSLISLRIGDMIAIELARPEKLVEYTDGTTTIKGFFCENCTFDFRIIM